MGHYFINNDNLKTKEKRIYFKIHKTEFHFITDNGVFSKSGLDFGSRLLIETILTNKHQNVLDLGCGYGPIGLAYKYFNPDINLTMVDINERAVQLAKKNAYICNIDANIFISNGYTQIKSKFDMIISNPPIRVGKDLLYNLLRKSKDFLTENGMLIYVINKHLGSKSSLMFCKNIYNKVDVINKKSGYYVIRCIK